MQDLVVKFPPRMRAQIEQVAAEEFIPVPDATRALVLRAIFQRQIERARKQQQTDGAQR
jgi:hypothetical protein